MRFPRFRMAESLSRDGFRRYRVAAVAVIALGIALSVAAFFATRSNERDVVRLTFEQTAQNDVAAINLAMFMGPEDKPAMGAMWGFLAGFGWVATFVGTHYLFERRSFKLFLINAGYSIVALTVMGVILAAWK